MPQETWIAIHSHNCLIFCLQKLQMNADGTVEIINIRQRCVKLITSKSTYFSRSDNTRHNNIFVSNKFQNSPLYLSDMPVIDPQNWVTHQPLNSSLIQMANQRNTQEEFERLVSAGFGSYVDDYNSKL